MADKDSRKRLRRSESSDKDVDEVVQQPQQDDIIDINVGGERISSLRSTLCVAEGSMFSNMFSGRWDEGLKRDQDGCIFIDEDPEFIKIIINCLRDRKREDPSKTIQYLPHVIAIPYEKRQHFVSLLNYYGLVPFFMDQVQTYPTEEWDVKVLSHCDGKLTTKISESKISLDSNYEGAHNEYAIFFVGITPPLNTLIGSVGVAAWKVTICQNHPHTAIFLGISQEDRGTVIDPTTYGWHQNGPISAGKDEDGCTYSSFGNNDTCYFFMNQKTLTMYSVTKARSFDIDIKNLDQSEPTCINLGINPAHEVTIEQVSSEELFRWQTLDVPV